MKAKLEKAVVIFFATGMGAGYSPIAPGTAGSLLACLFLWLVLPSTTVIVGLAGVLFVIGSWASGRACQVFNKPDASHIVIDEIVGMLITMIGIPLTNIWLVVGFLLFRIFDIFKPPPASYFDSKIKTGWGVMMDDVVAGVYANIALHLIIFVQK